MSSADKIKLDGTAPAAHNHAGYATLTFTAVDSGTCRIELNGVI